MIRPRFRRARGAKAPATPVTVVVNGQAVAADPAQSLLALLLTTAADEARPDWHCAIGQCQRCLVCVDGRPATACTTYPTGGETVTTLSEKA